MRRICLMVAASLATLSAMGAAAPAMAQEAPGSGMTLTRADYDGGNFRQGAGTAWTEYQGTRVMYRFREISRDANAVVLLDSSRDTRIELNLVRQMIRVSWSHNSPFEDLYPIVATAHSAGGEGARPVNIVRPDPAAVTDGPAPNDYSTQENFKVEAGPIASDGQANARCPGLAYRVHGSWTGGWERRDGMHSVCVVRFAR
jgi:hypothetical protein